MGGHSPLSQRELSTLILNGDQVESLLTSIDSRLAGGIPATITFPDNSPFNLAQYGGVDVSAGNALYVRPGTGAGFNITQFAGEVVPIGAGLEATAVRVTLPTDGTGVVIAKQATAANLNATVVQGTATNLKTQAEAYQGGAAVAAGNPLLVSLANTAANGTAVKVDGSAVTQSTSEVAPTTIYNGKTTVTTAGTQVALASSQAVKSVTIKALIGNTGSIYVGNSSVSSADGFVLAKGDTVSLDIANLATVYIDSSENGEGVTYIAIN